MRIRLLSGRESTLGLECVVVQRVRTLMILGAVRKERVGRALLCGLLGAAWGKHGQWRRRCGSAGGANRVGGDRWGGATSRPRGHECRFFQEWTYRERRGALESAKAVNTIGTDSGQGGTRSGKSMICESLGRGAMSIGHIEPCWQ
jgi:hypothetical protein